MQWRPGRSRAPDASNRAIADMVGVNPSTVDRDLAANTAKEETDTRERGDDVAANAAFSQSGREAAQAAKAKAEREASEAADGTTGRDFLYHRF